MPYKLVWRNGIPMTEWVPAPKKKALPPLTGGRGQPPGGGGYFPGPGRSWGIRGGKDPYLVDRMVTFPKTTAAAPAAPPGTTPGTTPGTPGTAPGIPPATDGAAGDPWQKYLDELDRRERLAYMDRIRHAQESERNRLEALQGFGLALQGNAAEQWGNIIKAYGRAGDTTTAYQNAGASSYGQGLMDANRQIAQDFAAIGQAGAPAIRDDAAALAQVQSVGGTNPGALAGLVGRAWGSYGETRPGTIAFMTQQNQMQVAREAAATEAELHSQMAEAMADNPQEAMGMWKMYEDWKSAKTAEEAKVKQDELENKLAERNQAFSEWLAKQKNTRENQAFALQVQDYMRKAGYTAAQIANYLSDNSGTVWTVKNGQPYNTGKPTVASRTAAETKRHHQATEAAAKTANTIRQQNANTAQAKAARAADKAKGTGGMTPNQLLIRENGWITNMTKQVNAYLGIPGVGKTPTRKPPKKADIVRQVYNLIGRNLAGKAPRWTEGYLKSLINSYLETLPHAWWAKGFKPGSGGEAPGL